MRRPYRAITADKFVELMNERNIALRNLVDITEYTSINLIHRWLKSPIAFKHRRKWFTDLANRIIEEDYRGDKKISMIMPTVEGTIAKKAQCKPRKILEEKEAEKEQLEKCRTCVWKKWTGVEQKYTCLFHDCFM